MNTISLPPILILMISLAVILPIPELTAQHPGNRYQNLEELLGILAGETEEGEEASAWMEELQELNDHPVDINTADKEELLMIPFINAVIATAIVDYRARYGAFFSPFELASVPGVGRDLAEKVSFFVVTGEANSGERGSGGRHGEEHLVSRDSLPRKIGYHQVMTRGSVTLPVAAGYRSDGEKAAAYAGSPVKLYTRYRFVIPGILQAGFTGEKDPGETFFKKPNATGFDFCSGHVSVRVSKRIPQVIVGDFTARSGQGLVLWQGFSLGKSAGVVQASKNKSQIRAYTSTDENRFFHGVATTLQVKNGTMNIFISSKKSDGNRAVAEDSTVIVTSLQTSGYHRTLTEAEDKNSVRHTVAGGMVNFTPENVKIGCTALYERFHFPFDPGNQLYEKFLFKGRENGNIGIDYRWVAGRYQVFGEAAVSLSGGIATLQGVEARLHDQMTMALLFRHFDRDYHATWAAAFAGNAGAINETGIYAGLFILPSSGTKVSAYADWFRAPWLKYTTAAPSQGSEYMVQADYRHSRKFSGYLRYKNSLRESKTTGDNLYIIKTEGHNNLRLHAQWEITPQWSFRSRIETTWLTTSPSEKGMLVFGDITWTPLELPLTATFRVAWFVTDSYNSRIYAYENDLLYAFSSPSFFGKGMRSFLNLRWKLTPALDTWFKAGCTLSAGEEPAGSGYNEIPGKCKIELKLQVRHRF